MEYRKKPVVIDAVQWTLKNEVEIAEFLGGPFKITENGSIEIVTLEGTMLASPGDWIIRGVHGEFYPCKPDIFAETYDKAHGTDNWIGAPLKEPKPEPKILYVSGPMSHIEDSNYPAFNKAAALLRQAGYEVLNPAEINPIGHQYADLLAMDIVDVLKCEGVAVLEGWWNSVGARLETNIAGTLGKPVRPVEEWMWRAGHKMIEADAPVTD